MPVRNTTTLIAGIVLFATLATSAAAQLAAPAATPAGSPKNSLALTGSFGYLFAQTTGAGGDQMPAGWIASIEGVLNGKYAAVGEFAGNYQAAHLYRTNLVGGRFIFKRTDKVALFTQLLAGKGRSAAVGDGESAFTLQPGAGVDLFVIPHVGIRLQGDYDWRPRPEGPVNGYRFGASIVIR